MVLRTSGRILGFLVAFAFDVTSTGATLSTSARASGSANSLQRISDADLKKCEHAFPELFRKGRSWGIWKQDERFQRLIQELTEVSRQERKFDECRTLLEFFDAIKEKVTKQLKRNEETWLYNQPKYSIERYCHLSQTIRSLTHYEVAFHERTFELQEYLAKQLIRMVRLGSFHWLEHSKIAGSTPYQKLVTYFSDVQPYSMVPEGILAPIKVIRDLEEVEAFRAKAQHSLSKASKMQNGSQREIDAEIVPFNPHGIPIAEAVICQPLEQSIEE